MIWIFLYLVSALISARFFQATWLVWCKEENDGSPAWLSIILLAAIMGPIGITSTMFTFEKKYWSL